jgi:predicted metal-dependent phosphoesterase TrpH
MARVDLHCHSTASDGECAPADVARRARAVGLVAIALTDHDTTAGVAEATREGDAIGVRVVCGCEFSTRAPWGELHLLGYFLDPASSALQGFLVETRAARERRGEQMVAKLQNLGVDIELEDVAAQAAGGAVGRPHVARALVERGVSADINEAFERYLGRGRVAFVEKPLPSLERVTTLVHEVGGIAVAAHLGDHGTEKQVRQFQEQGLDGIEVRHPSHSPATEARLAGIAGRLGLVTSGGSDWHGDTKFGESHAPLGGLEIPLEWLERLERKRAAVANTATMGRENG